MNTTGARLSRIGILVVVAIIAVIGLIVTAFIHHRLSDRVDYLMTNCTEVTTGVVYTKPKSGLPFFSENVVGSEFTLDDKHYSVAGIDDSKHDRGETVTVHYNPNRPVEGYSGVKPSVYNVKIFILVYAAFAILLVGAGAALMYYAIGDK